MRHAKDSIWHAFVEFGQLESRRTLETVPSETSKGVQPRINAKDVEKELLVGSQRLRVRPEVEMISVNNSGRRIFRLQIKETIDDSKSAIATSKWRCPTKEGE